MTTARCELSDLPVDGCAHCRGHVEPKPSRVATSNPFSAKYSGKCAICGDAFPTCTSIVFVEGGTAHKECAT